MEDFAPLFWVLLTVAAMIYSGVSKARKQAAKAAKQVPGPADEAWPRTDGDKWDEELPDDSQWSREASSAERADGPAEAARSMTAETGPRTSAGSRVSAGAGSAASHRTSWASGTSSSSASGEPDAGEADEAVSLEEIPDNVFRPGTTLGTEYGTDYGSDYGTKLKTAHQAAYEPPKDAASHRRKKVVQTAANTAFGDEIGSDDADDTRIGNEEAPGEEFDLRKAVIYSEILKPKFEE